MKTDRSTVFVLVFLAAVLTVALLTYRPGLSGPLLLDDIPQLEGLIKDSAIDPATLFGNYIISTSGPSGRPVAMATFIADAIAHGPDIWWWKYGNLMIHLINGLLAFWLTALLFRASPVRGSIDPWIAGAVVAALWLLHPLQVSTVLYAVQRMTQLSTLFVLAALVCYVKGRLVQEQSRGVGWALIALGFLVFYPLGIFSKENALIYPVFCSLIELVVFRFRGSPPLARRMKIFHGLLFAGYLAAAAVVLTNFSSIVLEAYETRDFTLSERVLTQFRVLVMYLSMVLLPIQRNMGFFHDDLTLSTGLLDPGTTLLSAAFLLALVAVAIVLRRRLPLFSLGVLFFLASHAVESSVLGLELMFEHRNYIGSLGLMMAVVAVGSLARDHMRPLAVLAAIGLVGFSLLTWQRALTWSSPEYLYQYMYRAHPESPRLNLVYANLFAIAGDFNRAEGLLDKSKPGFGRELHRLFFDCLEKQRVDPQALQQVSEIRDGVIDVYAATSADSLVQEVVSGRCDVPRESLAEALDHIIAAPSRSPTNRMLLLFTKAALLESMGQIDVAVDQYLAAQELADRDALALYKAAAALIRAGRLDAAKNMLSKAEEFERGIRMRRTDTAQRVYSALGMAYENGGQLEQALSVYEQAVRSMPRESLFYVKTAKLLLDMQRYEEVRVMLDDIRGRELVNLGEYQYALDRIATELARVSR